MSVNASERVVTSHSRLVAYLAVAVLIFAPTLVRAAQNLDCRSPSSGLTFSRGSVSPPVRVHLTPPDTAIVVSTPVNESRFACIAGRPSTSDESIFELPFDASPESPRGPPSHSFA